MVSAGSAGYFRGLASRDGGKRKKGLQRAKIHSNIVKLSSNSISTEDGARCREKVEEDEGDACCTLYKRPGGTLMDPKMQ